MLLTACSSGPKGSDRVAYVRVKDWRNSLNLSQLERQYDLPKGLLSAVMHQESAGKASARSHVGAVGLFQIMPATARDLNLMDPYNPEPSAQAAAQYLSTLYKRYRGNLNLTLAAYNWGMGNVDRYMLNDDTRNIDKVPLETRNYVARVNKLRHFYN